MKTARHVTILLAILGFFLILMYVSPFYIIVVNSFKTQREFFENVLQWPSSLYLNNYKQAMKDIKYFEAIGNTLFITVGSLISIVLLSGMAAWRLTRTRGRRISRFFYYLLIAGMLVPFQGIMLPFVSWVNKLGLMNKAGMWFIYTGFGAGMATFLISGFVGNIPMDIEEAALIDGCGTWKLYWRIVFPMLRTILLSVIFLDLIWIWNDYLMPSLIINQPGNQTLPIMVFQFFGGQFRKWSLALAALVMVITPVVVFYIFAQKWVIKGIASGAVKM